MPPTLPEAPTTQPKPEAQPSRQRALTTITRPPRSPLCRNTEPPDEIGLPSDLGIACPFCIE
jgi:hypothetical protein